jgi:FRG domain-containing protein
MAKLEYYSTLADKQASFSSEVNAVRYFKIDQASQFKQWYDEMKLLMTANRLGNFFRGIGEARFKLYNSAQRFWMQNNLMQLEAISKPILYIRMVQDMVDAAKKQDLFKKAFDYYGLTAEQTDFPILSILQHYGAPTPLMDWTYNLDVALFFAVEQAKHFERDDDIENYMSVYRIVKSDQSTFIKSNLQVVSGNVFPSITFLGTTWPDTVYYISDFEVKDQRQIKPLTTFYNLNILPQEGLFIFNPLETDPLEKIAVRKSPASMIICYNINKDLAEMVRLTINKNGINQSFIYPELKIYAGTILKKYLGGLV